jgi:hypothetical protein
LLSLSRPIISMIASMVSVTRGWKVGRSAPSAAASAL